MEHYFPHQDKQGNRQQNKCSQTAVYGSNKLLKPEHTSEKSVHSDDIDEHKAEGNGHACYH